MGRRMMHTVQCTGTDGKAVNGPATPDGNYPGLDENMQVVQYPSNALQNHLSFFAKKMDGKK